jgi:ribosomal protein L12E/L44/L45/RPP1/RPP2
MQATHTHTKSTTRERLVAKHAHTSRVHQLQPIAFESLSLRFHFLCVFVPGAWSEQTLMMRKEEEEEEKEEEEEGEEEEEEEEEVATYTPFCI